MLKIITEALAQIQSQGSFSSKQASSTDDLHVEIKGIGVLNFPLKPGLIKKLIKQARPAKFGWQEQTRIDSKVRDTWEIPKSNIKIDKRLWNKTLYPILDQLKHALGIPTKASLTAQLHNFLIYEPGQHFQPHQDSEKYDGMIATLVVVLPSPHRGGALIINHKGEQKRYQSSTTSVNKLSFFAFYADCRHEVRSVTEGYRVVLTYNLVLDNAQERYPDSSINFIHQPLLHALDKYFLQDRFGESTPTMDRKETKRLVYLLDHEYTPKSLCWKNLKNIDKFRAQALTSTAKTLGLNIYLGLADIQEMWDCEVEYDYNGYYGNGSRYWNEDEDEDEDEEKEDECEKHNDGKIELTELLSEDTTVRHWMDVNGKTVNFQALYISSDSLCWTRATDHFKPFEEEYEGYMGNYGNTMDRWYHRAAIILWQKTDHYAVLLEIDPASTMAEILQLAQNKSTYSQALEIVRQLLPNWVEKSLQLDTTAYFHIMKLALLIDEPELAKALLTPLGADAICAKTTPTLTLLNTAYGAQWCINIMHHWLSAPNQYFNKTNLLVKSLPTVIKKLAVNTHSKNKQLSDWLLEHQLTVITKDHLTQKDNLQLAQLHRLISDRIKEVTELLTVSIMTLNKKIYHHMLSFLIENPILYPAVDLASIVLHFHREHQRTELTDWDQQKLFNYVFNKLTADVNQPPRQTDDWSIRDKNTCQCTDCETLNHFLQSSGKTVKVWPLAKRRRQHIHQIIDTMALPVTHKTKRMGSPHKLELKKTDKLFTQDKARGFELKKTLDELTKKIGKIQRTTAQP